MKERPILFSAEMVNAILEERKSQTRRIVKKQYLVEVWPQKCPYGIVGDRLWVKETSIIAPKRWSTLDSSSIKDYDGDLRQIQYIATHSCTEAASDYGLKKTPSIFMPRWASRITLEITGVRVERLNEINRGDAMEEGFPFPNMAAGPDPREWYSDLWESINGPGSWDLNPWVWVIEFRRVEK